MFTRKNTLYSAAALIALCLISLGLHLYRIDYPAHPLFDEAHFATYAGDYASGHPFEDIHPPLGELIYGSVLSFYPQQDFNKAQFVKTAKAPDGTLVTEGNDYDYGDFPYVALRILSALFGIALPVVFYFFLKNIGVSRVGAALGALFIVFDNALLLDSRLILMDIMFITFGFAALAVYFHRKRYIFAAGTLWGLALAVKLTAIVFLGAPIVAILLAHGIQKKKAEIRSLISFVCMGLLVLMLVAFAGTLFFGTSARLQQFQTTGCFTPKSVQLFSAWQTQHPVAAYITADLCGVMYSLTNYVIGGPHPAESPWYFWPAMEIPLLYYEIVPGASTSPIMLTGNLIEWLAGTFAVIVALAFFLRYLKHHLKRDDDKISPMFLLLAGYAANLLPFILIVRRSTFLYHYFTSLIFSFGLLAWFTAQWLGVHDWTDFTPKKIFLCSTIVLIVIAGFSYSARFTYGF